MSQLTNTQATLLGFLMNQQKTGWEFVQDSMAGFSWFWTLTTSHIYRELKTLEGMNYIAIAEIGPRGRKHFEITEAGRTAFKNWLHEPPSDDHVRFPFLVKLWFGEHIDPDVLERNRINTINARRERIEAYRQIAELVKGNPHQREVMDMGIQFEEAALAWLEGLDFNELAKRDEEDERNIAAC